MQKNVGFIVKKKEIVFAAVIATFILSEYTIIFKWMDTLHIKHYLLWLALFIYGIKIIFKSEVPFGKEKHIVGRACIILYGISIFYQVVNGKFQLYSLEELYYLLVPLFFVVTVAYFLDRVNIDRIIIFSFYVCEFALLMGVFRQGALTLKNIKALFDIRTLLLESKGAMIETDLSIFFVMYYIYFSYKNYRNRKIISFISIFAGGKRMAALYAVIMFFALKMMPKEKTVNKKIVLITVAVFCVLPIATYVMCTNQFAQWFYLKFGIDFDQFTMTRFSIINAVVDAHLTNYGLGTVTNFLEKRAVVGQVNMHNDILRVYMECGPIGIVTFAGSYFAIAKYNYFSYFLMLFIFIELYVAHFIGPGSTVVWMIAYLMLFVFNDTDKKEMNNL